MNIKAHLVTKVLMCLVLLLWATYTLRPVAIIVAIGFCVSLLVSKIQQKVWPAVVLGLLVLIIPLQPYTVTFVNIEGAPKFLSCCPGGPPYIENWRSTIKKQDTGECMFCSDISTGFNPKIYLVW